MAETLMLMCVECGDSLVLIKRFETDAIRSGDKTIVETIDDLGKPSTVRRHADPVAIAFFFTKGSVPAEAGYTYDGIDKAKDLFDLFDGYYLPEVDPFHLPGDNAAYQASYEPRYPGETIDPPDAPRG